MTAASVMLLPTLVVAWTAGSLVSSRVTTHVAQASSAEVAANAAAVLRQSGLAATAEDEDALVLLVDLEDSVPAWQYLDTAAARNPYSLDLRVYDATGRVVYARDRSQVGVEVAFDETLAGALAGERRTRVDAASSYSVLVPIVQRDGQASGVLEVTQDLRPIAPDIALARWTVFTVAAAVSVLLVVLTAVFASRLTRRSFFDPVTALPNLSYLRSAARYVLEEAGPAARSGGLVLIDIERFALVNDALGRAQGDRLLRDLADRVRDSVRGADYVARLGSDDFAVLMPAADEAAARAAAERAVKAIARPFVAGGREIRLEASAGVALFPRDALELDGLLQRAETALESAKRTRRGTAVYRRDEEDTRRHSLYLESDLRSAIERGELSLAYQPICYLPTGEVVGLETLARWRHPTRGPVPPSKFVEIAERGGFVDKLDAWVLREATAQLAAWWRRGCEVLVTVNVSSQTLSDPALPARIAELLAETGAPAELLVLEVTERTALDDFESSAGVLRHLRDTGVRIALDDFGRGYSSLSTLDALPISFLKLDGSFARGIGSSAKDEHLVRALKLFTKGIGIPLVVEGVESERQRAWLVEQGVRFGQGYLFSPPTAGEDVVPPMGSRGAARLRPDEDVAARTLN